MIIQLSDIKPASRQVRQSWDEDKLDELTQSVQEQGLIVPVKVRPNGAGYELVYGHRRVEAMRRAGFSATDALVEGVADDRAFQEAYIENVIREDMTEFEKGQALILINKDTEWSTREMARRGLVKDQSEAVHLMQLAREPEEVVKALAGPDGRVHQGDTAHKASLIRSALGNDVETRAAVAEKVTSENLGRPQVAQVARAIANEPDPEVREELLQRPYNGNERKWEALSRQKVKEDKELKEAGVSSFEWQARPEVSAVLSYLKNLEGDQVEEWYRLVEMGKFAPEGISFFRRRLKRAGKTLLALADDLEKFEDD